MEQYTLRVNKAFIAAIFFCFLYVFDSISSKEQSFLFGNGVVVINLCEVQLLSVVHGNFVYFVRTIILFAHSTCCSVQIFHPQFY